MNFDKLFDTILLELSTKVGKIDLNNKNHIVELYDVLLENGFNNLIANEYVREIKNKLAEANFKVKNFDLKSIISNKFGFNTPGKDDNRLNVPIDFDVNKFIDELNKDEELKDEIGYSKAESIAPGESGSVSSSYDTLVLYNQKGKSSKFKLSMQSAKQAKKGKATGAADYEAAIAVAYNIKQGMNKNEAIKKAGIDKTKFLELEGMILPVGEAVAKELTGPEYLGNVGSSKFPVSDKWPSTDGTPKTDIFGGDEYRISLKMTGGSQLMSGATEAVGVFDAALDYYTEYEGKDYNKHIEEFITKMAEGFSSVKMVKSMKTIKDELFDAWFKLREKDVTEKMDELFPKDVGKAKQKDKIKKHIQSELIKAGYLDKMGDYNNWIIDGVDDLTDKVDSWFKDEYLKNIEDADKINQIFNLTKLHNELQQELTNIFEDFDFKKWVVFEAATGRYKFSGQVKPQALEPIANRILVFSENGIENYEPLTAEWAKNYAPHVKHTVGFKSANNTKMSAIRLLTASAETNDELQFNLDLTDIMKEEKESFVNEYIAYSKELEEGVFDKVKNIFVWMADGLEKFWNNVVMKIINKIKEYANKGINYLAKAFGIEIKGSSTVDVTF